MEKELNYKLTGENTELVKGESSQKAIENQSPKGNVVNTITVEEVKDIAKKENEETPVLPDNVVQIHTFEEGTILTDAILDKVKSGDIVKVNQMEFVVNNKVNQSPRSITGKMVGTISSTSISVITLEWVKGQELEPTLTTMDKGGGTKLHQHVLKVGSEVRAILISTVSRELVNNDRQGIMYGFVMSDSEAKQTIVTYIKATSDTVANTIGNLQQTFSNSYGVFKFTGISNGELQFESVIPYEDAENFSDAVTEL